jgi:hypothetical protein
VSVSEKAIAEFSNNFVTMPGKCINRIRRGLNPEKVFDRRHHIHNQAGFDSLDAPISYGLNWHCARFDCASGKLYVRRLVLESESVRFGMEMEFDFMIALVDRTYHHQRYLMLILILR